MKRKAALALAALLILGGCSSKTTQTETTTTAETTTEATTAEQTTAAQITTEAVTLTPEQSFNKNGEVVTFAEPYTNPSPDDSFEVNASGSPIQNVSGGLYNDVSAAVRSYANEVYMDSLAESFAADTANMDKNNSEMDEMRASWLSKAELYDDEAFAEAGYQLIFAYSQMAKCKLLYDNYEQQISENDKALYADILTDLEANTEIFLNMESISAVSANADFTCRDRIQQFLNNISSLVK